MTNGGGVKRPSADSSVTDRFANAIQIGVMLLVIVLLIAVPVFIYNFGLPVAKQLHYNPYAVASIVSAIVNIIALTLVWRIKQQTDALMWFSVFLLSIASWAAAEAMIRLSATPEPATFWSPMSTVGSAVMPIGLYMFVLAYTDPRRARNPIIFPSLAVVGALLIYADQRTDLVSIYKSNSVTKSAWGYSSATGDAYFTIAAWVVLLTLACLLLLIRFHNATLEPKLRQQSKLFIIAIAIPLAVGTITDGILPALHVVAVPRMTVMLLTVTGVIICYGILRHRFFRLTPALIAGQILDTMNEAVVGLGNDLNLNYANNGAERLFGISKSKLADKHLDDFVAEDWSAEWLQKALLEPLKDKDTHTVDSLDFKTAEGQIITTKLSITKVFDEDQPYGYLVVLTDITAIANTKSIIEKQVTDRTNELNQEHARLQAAINSLDIGLLMTFKDQAAISYNSALPHILNMKGAAEADEDDKIDVDMLHDKLAVSKFDLKAAIEGAQQKGQPFEAKELTYDNRILTVFGAPIMVQLDKIIGVVVLVEDITEQKVLERSKDEFFSIASHELRTPLTSIKGNASMILDFYKDTLKDPQLNEMIVDVHESAVRLIEIVNDFLDTSRLEQGKMNFDYSAVSLEEVIENVAYEMKTVMDERKLYLKMDKLTLDRLPKVWADKNKIKQVIYNLVGNGAKFTETGGITVSAELDGKDSEFVRVDITDSGRGMPPEAQKLLFHKFQQAGSSLITRDTTRGTGLGLYICKMIVENMGGSIGLTKSEEGVGSTFSFRIPVATDKLIAEAKAKADTATVQTDSGTGMTTGESDNNATRT